MAGNGSNGNGKGPPNLTEEQATELFDALEDGVPMPAAFGAVGIARSTYFRLKERAEKATKGSLKEWWDSIAQARDRGEVALWRRASAGGKGCGGAQWVLERSFGYWKTEKQEIEAKTETKGEVEFVLRRVPPRAEPPAKKGEADDGK